MKKTTFSHKEDSLSDPKKSLGQNFLQDKQVLEEILQAGELTERDWVVEIGPGRGFLTEALLKKAGRVVAVEKDEALVAYLEKKFSSQIEQGRLKIFPADALRFNFMAFFQQEGVFEYKLIANLPYYITGQAFRIFQEMEIRPTLAVFLVQKEVAERVCAPVGEKSRLSIAADYFGYSQIIKQVGKEKFFPVPKVDSAVLKMVFRKKEELFHQDPEKRRAFFHLVKLGFSSKRKTLLNNLKIEYDKEKILRCLSKQALDSKIRAQALSLEDWLGLNNCLGN